MSDQVLQDPQTVTTDGERVQKLPEGVTFHEVKTQLDERGSLCEMYDPRWGWHKDPLLYAYFITIRPGVIKGWAMHKLHEDRYFIQFGDMEVILYDARPESPTHELVSLWSCQNTVDDL